MADAKKTFGEKAKDVVKAAVRVFDTLIGADGVYKAEETAAANQRALAAMEKDRRTRMLGDRKP